MTLDAVTGALMLGSCSFGLGPEGSRQSSNRSSWQPHEGDVRHPADMSPIVTGQERQARAEIVDCVVVGGGPAGLATAVQLGRLRRSCVVVDDNAGRSLWSQVTRNHLGFPDGVTAADLRLLGQRQAVAYGASLRDGEVTGLRRAAGRAAGFVVTIAATDDAEPDDETPGHGGEPGPRAATRRQTRRASHPPPDPDPCPDGVAGDGRR